VQLSVLDVAGDVDDTVELAPLADELGFARYWIAEHVPQPSPIVVVSIVAGLTSRIRVGTAGILLHYYQTQRTAHDYQFLTRMYGGRIDAGFCGAIAPNLAREELDGVDSGALVASYDTRVARFARHLRNVPETPHFDEATCWSGVAEAPQIWSLGGGRRSSELAAQHGLNLGYALLYKNSVDDPQFVQSYRSTFVPATTGDRPRVAVAVCGVCEDTDEAARATAESIAGRFFHPTVVGSAATCAAQLRAIGERYHADELVFADLLTGLDKRRRCYQLLAASFGLEASPSTTS
jgi:luciferase family oxidoreductase group 1